MLAAKDILTLLMIPRVGRKRVQSLAYSAHDTPNSLQELLLLANQASIRITWEQLQVAAEKAQEMQLSCQQQRIRLLAPIDTQFPSSLKSIADKPVLLWVKGNVALLNAPTKVAIIGTRNPSPEGRKMAYDLGNKLAQNNTVVVSGLALGCDTAAHKGCLAARGKTIAILAHGLDTVYPATNRQLASRIVQADGCLVSEYPLGTGIQRYQFVERDRLQSGVSHGVVVVECGVTSGTMHTARYAKKQSRPIGCVVFEGLSSDDSQRNGNYQLVQEGVFEILKPENILSFLPMRQPSRSLFKRGPRYRGQKNNAKDKPAGVFAMFMSKPRRLPALPVTPHDSTPVSNNSTAPSQPAACSLSPNVRKRVEGSRQKALERLHKKRRARVAQQRLLGKRGEPAEPLPNTEATSTFGRKVQMQLTIHAPLKSTASHIMLNQHSGTHNSNSTEDALDAGKIHGR